MSDQTVDFEAAWAISQAPATGRRAQAHRLANAMRRVIDHLVQVAAPEEDLSAAADALERYARRLSKYPISRSYEGFAESAAVTVRVTGTLSGLLDALLVAVKTTLPVYTPVASPANTVLLMETVSEPGVVPLPGVTVSQLPPLLVVAATV